MKNYSSWMKLFEYEAAEVLRKKNIPYPDFRTASTPAEAVEAAEELGLPVVLKAQVQVGGRGKAGGIEIAESLVEVEKVAENMLGSHIKGEKVSKLVVARFVRTIDEFYVAFIIDRSFERHLLLASRHGGIDIEESMTAQPETLRKIPIDPIIGLQEHHVRRAVNFLGLRGEQAKECGDIVKKLYEIYVELGCELVEINPLALTPDPKLIALDAKITIDDNAVRNYRLNFRRDEGTLEEEARSIGINYVGLDGEIGIISNGAGLTMATMDLVSHFGGRPANFLDIGGGAGAEIVFKAVTLLLRDEKVKVLFINVLGGLTRCDEVASGIVRAIKESPTHKKIVVRLAGNREEVGRRILLENGLDFYESMDEAAKKAVELSKC
jgi:succinyl-CoA synthetase beta subunit